MTTKKADSTDQQHKHESEMRLKNPSQSFSSNADGSNAEIVDKLLGTAERKRARPTSSLDIKVDDGEKLAHAPNKIPLQQQKPKYQLSDLDGMSEEELLQALYDDPELAATAAAAAEKIKKKKSSTTTQKKQRSGGRVPPRGGTGTGSGAHESKRINEHPAHLQAMMKDGVPVTQWVFVLLLVGACLYQLRKVLAPTSAAATRPKRPTKQTGKKTKKGKSSRKPAAAHSHSKRAEEASVGRQIVVEEGKETVKPASVNKPSSSLLLSSSSSSSSKKKSKSRKQKTANKAAAAAAKSASNKAVPPPSDQPDSISTDGSSSTDGVDQMGLSNGEDDLVITAPASQSLSTQQQDNGWTTVGTKAKNEKQPEEAALPETPAQREALPATISAASTVVKDESVEEEKKIDDEPEIKENEGGDQTASSREEPASKTPQEEASQGDASPDESAAKPSSSSSSSSSSAEEAAAKTKAAAPSVAVADAGTEPEHEAVSEDDEVAASRSADTADDEALAKLLQREEERLSKPLVDSPQEEAWAEVPVKRKKKQQT